MDKIVSKLLIYSDIPKDSILLQLSSVCSELRKGEYNKEDLITKIYKLSDTVRELKDDLANYYNPKAPQELIEEQIGDYRRF